MKNPWSTGPRRPHPAYIVKKGAGNTWKIMDYCVLYLAGEEGDKPEVYQDNIYDKVEADRIALRLNIEWWDELSRIQDELNEGKPDPRDEFNVEDE